MCLAMNPDKLEPGERCAADQQPQLRGPARQRRPHAPGLARHGRRRRHPRPVRGYPRVGVQELSGSSRDRQFDDIPFEDIHEPFTKHTGLVAVMDRADVDTDQIIPKQFLKRIERTGFEQLLFFDWRYLRRRQRQSGLRVESAGSPRRLDPGRPPQLRLRLQPRARRVGAGELRLPRRDRPQLCRHLLQQLLQERRAADQLDEEQVEQLFRRFARASGLPADGGPGSPHDHATPSDCSSASKSTTSAATACCTAWTTSA